MHNLQLERRDGMGGDAKRVKGSVCGSRITLRRRIIAQMLLRLAGTLGQAFEAALSMFRANFRRYLDRRNIHVQQLLEGFQTVFQV